MAVTDDHDQAFSEAYAHAGVLVDIDGTSNIQAIWPRNNSVTIDRDEDGLFQKPDVQEITVKNSDLADDDIGTSTVVTFASGKEYRVTEYRPAGMNAKTLTIQYP